MTDRQAARTYGKGWRSIDTLPDYDAKARQQITVLTVKGLIVQVSVPRWQKPHLSTKNLPRRVPCYRWQRSGQVVAVAWRYPRIGYTPIGKA